MKRWHKHGAALAAAWLACSAPSGYAADAPTIPIEAFFARPDLTAPQLSPSGDALAMQMVVDGRRVLAVVDTATLKKITVVARFTTTDVGLASWVNDHRLVFNQQFETEVRARTAWHGLWAVDRDGGNLRQLIRPDLYRNSETGSHIKDHTLTSDYALARTIRDGSNDVVIEHAVFSSAGGGGRSHDEVVALMPMRLDTASGRTTALVDGPIPEHALQWNIDGQGRIRSVTTTYGGQDTLLAPRDRGWAQIAQFPSYGPGKDSLSAVISAADGAMYALRTSDTPERTRALYRFDADKGRADPAPLVLVKGYDFDGTLVEDECNHKLRGARFEADAKGTIWFDPALKALQARVDAALPGRVNLIDVAQCPNGAPAPALVTSTSDRVPAQYFLVGPGEAGLRAVGLSRPSLDPRQMAETDFVRIKARDGREIPVYVTRPRVKGPWPTVVLVHGGPNLRGWSWEWDVESQFLASRGYLVVKPEFRGSDGYGAKLLEAGYRQWGLAMQDDVADATRWAAAQGLSDPARVCIMGGSYGGYATLMGLARYPELYRCGVAFAAVADIDMMYETWWSDGPDDWRSFGMPVTVGDRTKDAAQFQATSPLRLAARIRQPLLLGHGRQDKRVPIEQATAMRDALQSSHASLTWVQYADEAHGLTLEADRLDYYRRVEAFLAANAGVRPGDTGK
jgi:dienelactone hydrolase